MDRSLPRRQPRRFCTGSMRRCWSRAVLLVVAAVIPARPSAAQNGFVDKRLVLSVQPTYGLSRGHAPVSLSISLRWSSPELLEGTLQLEWFVDTTKLGRHQWPDIALAESSVSLSVTLPPVVLPHDDAVFSVQGKFITDDAVYDLDVHDVALQPDWRRILVVGVCGAPRKLDASVLLSGAGALEPSLQESFKLEPFFESRFFNRELLVDDTDVDPSDVPVDPLKLTAFDVFVVPAESASRLKPRQLEALLTWVRAGGSLCVMIDTALAQTHVAWLNQLAGTDAANAAYLQTAEGKVLAALDAPRGVYQHRAGLGRAVVVLQPPEFASEEWKQAVLFLWKVRGDRRRAALRNRTWQLNLTDDIAHAGTYTSFEPRRVWQQDDLTKILLSDSVSGLPLRTVGIVLALFLLVIAPGDYLVLGWLKQRQWTWVLFPAVSLLFTAYTVWAAREHLGQNSYEHAITVIDVGQDGRPLRTSRFELLFSASNRQIVSEREQSMMTPLDPSIDRRAGQYGVFPASRHYEQPWTFVGRVPQNYTVLRDVQQWSPRLSRTTSFGSSAKDSTAPLTGLPPSHSDQASGDARHPAVPVVRVSSPTTVLRLSNSQRELLRHDPGLPDAIVWLAESITRRPEVGYFSIVSQLSPTTGGNWEDLALLDSSDPRQEAVVAVTSPQEGQYIIYRRLDWKQE